MKLRSPTRKEVVIDPTHANVGVEKWYTAELQDAVRQMRDSLLFHVRTAWKSAPPTIGFAADAKSSSQELRKVLDKWGSTWIKRLDDMAEQLADRFASKNQQATQISMRAAFKRAGFTVAFKPSAGSVDAFRAVVAENVSLIKSIPQQFLKDVQTSVWQSVMKGSDLAALTADIQQKYGVAYRRAAFIALDQNNKAKALIENVRRQEMELDEAIWQHSGGGKEPRPTHIGPTMNGKRYALKKGMWDSDEGKWVWPGELPRCRCTSRVVVPGYNG